MTARRSETKSGTRSGGTTRARKPAAAVTAAAQDVTTQQQPKRPDRRMPEQFRPEDSVMTVPVPGGHDAAGAEGRAFWSGSITIGLVNVPVRLHTIIRDKSFSFRLLHKTDGQPLRYDRVCTREDKVVPWSDTVRGYEVRKGEFLVFAPEELRAIMPESDRKIRLTKFVYYLSLDPMYFGTSYLLVPDRSEDAYSLLLTTIRENGKAGVGSITLRTKEHPVVVHAYGDGLVLTTLHYADEVTRPAAYAALRELPAPKAAELALAKRIVDELSGDFSMEEFHDRYREAVESLIEKKLAGEKLVYAEPHPEEAKELMEALKETIAKLPKK